MRKIDWKIVSAVGILIICIVFVVGVFLSGNAHNSIGNTNPNCDQWFEDTSFDVRNHQDRLYHIVKDKKGLYYFCSDIEGTLTLIVDENGKPITDMSWFQQ